MGWLFYLCPPTEYHFPGRCTILSRKFSPGGWDRPRRLMRQHASCTNPKYTLRPSKRHCPGTRPTASCMMTFRWDPRWRRTYHQHKTAELGTVTVNVGDDVGHAEEPPRKRFTQRPACPMVGAHHRAMSANSDHIGAPTKPRRPMLAAVLSGIFPGLGQLYNQERLKAVLFAAGGLLTSVGPFSPLDVDIDLNDPAAGMRRVLLAALPFLVLALWSVADAYRSARRARATWARRESAAEGDA